MKHQRQTVGGIISTYNQERYAAAAVSSLAAQVDELIVVDDASEDSTAARIATLNLPNVQLIRFKTNVGVSVAFNAAAEKLTTDIMLIQGGDDISLPERAKHQMQVLSNESTLLTHCVPEIIDSQGNLLDAYMAPEFQATHPPEHSLTELFFRGNTVCAPSVAMRRSTYFELGGFNVRLPHHQDYLLWLRAASQGTLHRDHRSLVRYRKHAANLSRQSRPGETRHAIKIEDFANTLVDFLSTAPISALLELARSTPAAWMITTDTPRQLLATMILLYHQENAVIARGLDSLHAFLGTQSPSKLELGGIGWSIHDYQRWQVRAARANRRKAEIF